ncbi:two-component hybrid sensor and regulator [Pseudooceanicola batsensis HTCC2597]|uniref:histidine kinase n=1 Tax=Pseudooceanicola batsensis (strain ATCC BAA-863 / DSM 15984 / KCTC 12145 / HTCC2597) TaxID=252305 RepID=A3U0N3_PSEBH|nr:cache domain-containing protein [Pseudooceanicola batsensis]EAQ02324.1 two-component hybrid sensor and regulator [Pseudooceanicola batsensis HTCC2597]
MRNSLGALLAIGLAGLQFVAVLAVVFSSYVTSERALLNHARDLLSDVGTNTIEHSRGFLGPARGAAELSARLAEDRVIASDVPELLEQLLFQQLLLAPQFAGVYHGGEDGEFVYVMRSEGPAPFRTKIIRVEDGVRTTELIWRDDDFNVVERRMDPLDTYDPRSRPWYIRARAELTTIWTDPYIFFSSQQPGITLASPVMDGPDAVRGIVGVDIEISEISEFLARLRIGSTGRALIIHENGDVIAHPNRSLLKTQDADGTLRFVDIAQFEDPIAREAFSDLVANGVIPVEHEMLSQFSFRNETYVSVVMPPISDNLPWTIAAYALESDFTEVIKQNRRNNFWIAALVAAITGLCGLALANYIYKPVRAFAVRSALISQGELDPSEPLPKTYQELENANRTLMQQIAARRETEIEYGRTFGLSSHGMAQIEAATGRFLRVNDKICEITGYSEDELTRMALADLVHPDEPLFLLSDGHGEDAPRAFNHEMRCLRRDGATVWTLVNAILIFNQEGKPIHYVLTMDDITPAKQTEDQIAELSKDLSNLSRDNTMGQVAAGLAHELNQPLTAIAQNADSALYSVDQIAGDHDGLRQTLEEIAEQSMRAGEIIKALRSFIRRDEGIRTDFDLGELVEQTKRLVIAEARAAGATIEADLADLPPVHANRIQIAQVLVNLLRNAVEAVADCESCDRRVLVRAERQGDQVLVAVEDTGPGVDPGISLFTEFETTKPTGMGLGLSICQSIVHANGGRLWHEPAEPQGARFCFTVAVGPA